MADHQGKRLKHFLSKHKKPGEKRKSIDEIAADLGVSRATLYNYFLRSELDEGFLETLEKKGYKFNLDEPLVFNDAVQVYQPPKGNIVYVPLVAYGGFLQGYSNKVFIDSLEKFSLPGIHGEHFAFEVQGNSMAPYANSGDLVIARKEESLEWMVKGRAYVLQTIDGLIVKQFEKMVDGKAQFRSANKDGNSPAIPLKAIKGVYQVVKVIKPFLLSN